MRNWNDNSATPSLGRIEDSVLFYLVMYCYLLSFPFQESGQLLLSGENNTYLWVYVSNWNHSFQKIFTPHPPPHQGPNLEAFSWIPRVGFSWLMGTLYGYKTMELNHVVSTITPRSKKALIQIEVETPLWPLLGFWCFRCLLIQYPKSCHAIGIGGTLGSVESWEIYNFSLNDHSKAI